MSILLFNGNALPSDLSNLFRLIQSCVGSAIHLSYLIGIKFWALDLRSGHHDGTMSFENISLICIN